MIVLALVGDDIQFGSFTKKAFSYSLGMEMETISLPESKILLKCDPDAPEVKIGRFCTNGKLTKYGEKYVTPAPQKLSEPVELPSFQEALDTAFDDEDDDIDAQNPQTQSSFVTNAKLMIHGCEGMTPEIFDKIWADQMVQHSIKTEDSVGLMEDVDRACRRNGLYRGMRDIIDDPLTRLKVMAGMR